MTMLSCKEASHLVSESQEHPLGWRERWGLRLHLWMCISCARFDRQIRLLRKALHILNRRAEADRIGVDMPPEVRERIRKALAERDEHRH
jgi:hypothetical protein